ncbi:MAG: LysM peptidoglycan-binding domain-containing protein [Clostridia bacterium]|nr:LysM peptidoglycan-binding domain-containing protein [Clostridia bacterium]
MEIIKETFNSYREIGRETLQAKVENDCIVPDVKPDVAEIVLATSSVTQMNARPYTDRVVISGQITYRVIYADENGGYDSMAVPGDFTTTVWVQGASPDSICLLNGTTVSTECGIINSRKINLKTMVELSVEIMGSEEIQLFTGVNSDNSMEIVTEQTQILESAGHLHFCKDLVSTLEAPQGGDMIGKILHFDMSPTDISRTVDYDRITIAGNMRMSVLYTGTDSNTIMLLEREVPFEVQEDSKGLLPETLLRTVITLESPYAQIVNDSDGEPTVIELGATLCVEGLAGTLRTVDYIKDGYSIELPLSAEKQPISFMSGIWHSTETVSFTEELMLPEAQVGEIVGVWAHLDNLEGTNHENTAAVKGNLSVNVLYTEQGNKGLMGASFSVPVNTAWDMSRCEGCRVCDVIGSIKNISCAVNSPVRLGLRFSVGMEIYTCSREGIQQVCDFLTDSRGFPANFSCGMVVYYPEKGETLWDVAARYMVTVEELKALNGIDGNTIPTRIFLPGKQIISKG